MNHDAPLPDWLTAQTEPAVYHRWRKRKAAAISRRDQQRGVSERSQAAVRAAIHDAVLVSQGKDAYTGEALNWGLISTYRNAESQAEGHAYKHRLALLPTVDHVDPAGGDFNFNICSWRTNDAKHDLSLDQWHELCKKVLLHAGYTVCDDPQTTPIS